MNYGRFGKRTNRTLLLLLMMWSVLSLQAQEITNCEAVLEQDTLYLRNGRIEMRFLWNDGHILLRHLQDLTGTVALEFCFVPL